MQICMMNEFGTLVMEARLHRVRHNGRHVWIMLRPEDETTHFPGQVRVRINVSHFVR